MPIYEYQCTDCDHIIEKIRHVEDRSRPVACDNPICSEEEPMIRKMSATSFVLKGVGWANDGYSSKKA